MTAQPVEERAPEVWGALSVFAYVPSVPGPALRVLLFLLGVQEPGGRIVIKQADIAQALGMKRSAVGLSLQHLQFARMVTKVQSGVYELHPQIAGFTTPAEQAQAVASLPREDCLDVDDFEERYQQAVEVHRQELQRKAQERLQGPKPPADLAAHRRRRAR
ncbi:hypothetical protein SAM9427_37160 (plasmid) [Streptomyces sp. ETH9427]|uniref:hypothetical protein n=1 Tax=Streptomyces sp. E1N211 TaxID=1851876 RepID=UPI000E0B340F|nr:hypothetical protein [Streptomyces sp. E1N211]AXI91399.1 hypothetical protein SAM9427_37160 [Streptomyces sp. ETH9427]